MSRDGYHAALSPSVTLRINSAKGLSADFDSGVLSKHDEPAARPAKGMNLCVTIYGAPGNTQSFQRGPHHGHADARQGLRDLA